VRAGEGVGFGRDKGLDAGGGEDVDLEEVVGAVALGEPVRVAAVAVDVAQGSGDAAVGEEEHEGVDAFGRVDVEVPEHVSVGGIGSRDGACASGGGTGIRRDRARRRPSHCFLRPS
jgi:hypothetical protein